MNTTTHGDRASVAVIGLGYIGLPTAVVLAQAGNNVIGVDVKKAAVDTINLGHAPFVEEGLETVLAGTVAQGKLRAQTETPSADSYIVSVPTPFKSEHEADLSFIEAAATGIAPKLTGGELIVLESTAPPGATEHMADTVLRLRPEFTKEPNLANSLYFSHAPERVLPGRIMVEMVENDRIIGGLTPEAAELNRTLYSTFCTGELLITDARTAEMAKLTENAFRDVNIAFANELSILAEQQGVNVWELIDLANHHPRVNILQPGPGVGGHCIAVDPWFLVAADRDNSKLIETARNVNDFKPQYISSKVLDLSDKFTQPTIAVLGIAFKANIDDLRQSPSRNIALDLARARSDANVLIVEPNIDALPEEFLTTDNIQLCQLESAVLEADIVLLLVDHDQFKTMNTDLLKEKIVVDTKGLWR